MNRKIKSLIESDNIIDQKEGVKLLEERGYISKKIRDFVFEQHTVPRLGHMTPNKYISVNIVDEELRIDFNYDLYKTGEIIKEIGAIKNLEKLFIHFKNGNAFPTTLTGNESIKELRLSFIGATYQLDLEKTYEILGSIKNLELLEMNYFKMTILPSSINKFKNIKKLYLHYNFIEELPEEICEIQSLEILNLSTNSLQRIPKKITKLTKLKLLDLRNNSLRKIPEDILQMKNLNLLDISDNKFPGWVLKKYENRKKEGLNLIK